MPCPVSGFFAMIVNVLSGWTVMYVLGASDHCDGAGAPPCWRECGHVHADDHAAAGKSGHLKERTTIELCRLCLVHGYALRPPLAAR